MTVLQVIFLLGGSAFIVGFFMTLGYLAAKGVTE